MPISQPTHTQPQPSSLPTTTPAPVPRSSSTSHRPRPLSMPPQAFNGVTASSAGSAAGGSTVSSSQEPRERERHHNGDENAHRRRHRDDSRTEHSSSSRPSRGTRILGDYTLGKTLGAGSMGKVKLAVHNTTGEKVRCGTSKVFWFSLTVSCSSLSRSFLESTLTRPRLALPVPAPKQRRGKPQRTHPRKSEPSARPPSPCSCITPTSAECAK